MGRREKEREIKSDALESEKGKQNTQRKMKRTKLSLDLNEDNRNVKIFILSHTHTSKDDEADEEGQSTCSITTQGQQGVRLRPGSHGLV